MPLCADCRLSGGSPLENETLTLPESSVAPQSSRTSVSSATGHAAGTPNDCPSVVITGTSCDGVQPAVPGSSCAALPRLAADDPAGGGVTIVRKPTRRMSPSENCSVSSASYTPGGSKPVSGCSTNFPGCDKESVELAGMKLNLFLGSPAMTLETYVWGVADTL